MVASMLALRTTTGADTPAVEKRHRGYGIPVSPRHVPATVHELTRVELLSGLPGEQLAQLAGRLQREEVSPGSTVVRQGEPGDRFYVVLSGMLNVTQDELGERRTLRPGDSFGEVALVMGIPRTASVRAITPAVVASCDKETFDELLRPIFADE
jgi:ATP-binding cassette, subfamily B, bacterial